MFGHSKQKGRLWVTMFVLFLLAPPLYAADTLPAKLADDAFWRLIGALSEPNGTFQSENLLSNETDFPQVMARLKQTATAGRVYLGVGPEQNFNYIAALRPKMAFIIDIRRQNMLEHLIYKALFEMSPDRVSFISHLFSRKPPPGLTVDLTAAELFDAYLDAPADKASFENNLKEIEDLLIRGHRFPLTGEDLAGIENVYAAFHDFGPLIDYNSRGGGPSARAFSPSYARLMTETDGTGKEWSYLANEDNYRYIRDIELRNLIVPLTGDFGGPKAIRAVGLYVKHHDALVSAFYTSNVEGYLFQGGDRRGNPNGGASKFYDNVSSVPLDESSTFIRWVPGTNGRPDSDTSIFLAPMLATIEDFKAGRFTAIDLFPTRRFGFGRGGFRGLLNVDRRSDFPVPVSRWAALAWIAFPLLAGGVAFVVRYFIWKPVNEGRRALYAAAWAVGGFVLALALGILFRF